MTLELILAIIAILTSLLSLAYGAGMLGQRVRTNERDIAEAKATIESTRSRLSDLATKEDILLLDQRLEKRLDQIDQRIGSHS